MKHFAVGTFLTALLLTNLSSAQTSLTTLYNFNATVAHEGRNPVGEIVMDKQGALYGVTLARLSGGGKIFQLAPPTMNGGSWTYTAIYKAENGPINQMSPVIVGLHGELFGTAIGCRCVFELLPPAVAGGAWTPVIIHTFMGAAQGDGLGAVAGKLAIDAAGNLYGASTRGGLNDSWAAGVVWELSPPAMPGGTWTETILYAFKAPGKTAIYRPLSPVALGPNGELYGSAIAQQKIGTQPVTYQLSRPPVPGNPWTISVIYIGFAIGPATVDPTGNIFTGGNFEELSPPSVPGGPWTLSFLSNGASSPGSMVLYGSMPFTQSVYKLTPPPPSGGTWTVSILHTFVGGSEGLQPMGVPIVDANGHVFGTTLIGGTGDCVARSGTGCGTIWELQ